MAELCGSDRRRPLSGIAIDNLYSLEGVHAYFARARKAIYNRDHDRLKLVLIENSFLNTSRCGARTETTHLTRGLSVLLRLHAWSATTNK